MRSENVHLYNRLFSAGRIGKLVVPNRIIMPAMMTCLSDGRYESQRLINYLEARARGGVGLIIHEITTVDPLGFVMPDQVAMFDDGCIPGMQRLTEVIHKHDKRIAVQLAHGGNRAFSKFVNAQPVSASDVTGRGGEKPRPLTLDEIQRLIESFVLAAERAIKAGFDGIEIHCAHGYLLRQFISPYSNKRTDRYGGDLAGRARLAIDIITGVRQSIGDFPMWARINGEDFIEDGGLSYEESKTICQWIEKAGVDAISVSGATYESPVNYMVAPMFVPRGKLVPFAEGIKKIVKVPVITVGRIDTPQFAEQILAEGKADFVAMGRALIADPELPNKAREGRENEIRRCIADNACLDGLFPGTILRCTVNAAIGKEGESKIVPAEKSKKVLIAGGGPAGMEAARIAALRGHEVVLCEKQPALGGQINVASKGKHKEDLNLVTSFLSCQLNSLGVDIRLNTTVTEALIEKLKPDVLVEATGSIQMIPSVPGVKQDNVAGAREVLMDEKKIGKRIVIIGGGRVGLEVAEYLKDTDNEITVVEMMAKIGRDLGDSFKFAYINKLKELNIKIMVNTRLEKINGSHITVNKSGELQELEADSIILAVGATPNQDIHTLAGTKLEKYRIGDCKQPRNIMEAISEGWELGHRI